MILRYDHLSRFPKVFQVMTGLRLAEFADLLTDVLRVLVRRKLNG